jgi:hypothetical protein
MKVYETLRLAGQLMTDHVHMLLPVLPKNAVAQAVGRIKGKSEIHIARGYAGRTRNFVGQHFWAKGYLGLGGDGRSAATRPACDAASKSGRKKTSAPQITATHGALRYYNPLEKPKVITPSLSSKVF